MKKSIALCVILGLLLAGCATEEPSPPAGPTSPPEPAAPTAEPLTCDGTCQGPIMAAIDIVDTVGFHAMGEDLAQAAVLSKVGPVIGMTAALDVINSTGFHGMQEEIEAAAAFEDVSPRDLGNVQNALWVSMAAPWPESLGESVAAFEADAQALVDALTAGDLAASQEAVAGIHHTQHSLSGEAYDWLATQAGEPGEGLIATVGVTAALDVINSTGFHGMQEEIEAAASFEDVSPRDLGNVQNALWVSMAAPWPESLGESVAAFEADAQALVDALTAGDLAASQEAVAGIHHTQHSLSGEAYEWLSSQNGADLLAGLINSRYLGRVRNALGVVRATPWFGDLVASADALAADLQALAEALEAGDVVAAAEAADAVHGTQHDLSHETYAWLSGQEDIAVQPDAVLAAMDIIDSTGFHGMSEEIESASSFDEVSPRNLGRVENALISGLVVTWPSALSSSAETFFADAQALVDALTVGDLTASKEAAHAIHASQHELSNAAYEWLGGQSGNATGVGAVISVIDIIDSAGFHGMQEEIEAAQTMEDISPRNLGRVQNAMIAAELVDWPSSLDEPAQAFISSAQDLAEALEAGDLGAAQEAAGGIHHTQHDLSNAAYGWVSEQGGGTRVAGNETSETTPGSEEAALPAEYADAKVIALEVDDWLWDPSTITLKRDEPVVLEISNVGLMPHGIWIPALAINVDTPPGEITLVTLTPQEIGEFLLGCNEPMCGTDEQHTEMSAKIIVSD